MWGHMDGYGWGWGWGGMGFGMLLFWGVLIAAVVLLARNTWGSGTCSGRAREKTALDLLKERYARGEIERDEFEQKKRDLENRGGIPMSDIAGGTNDSPFVVSRNIPLKPFEEENLLEVIRNLMARDLIIGVHADSPNRLHISYDASCVGIRDIETWLEEADLHRPWIQFASEIFLVRLSR